MAALLRRVTRGVHAAAETTGFVADVVQGQVTHASYALFLRNLLPAYRCLERGLEDRRGKPVVAAMARPELYRSRAIAFDLAALAGPEWQNKLRLLDAGAAYAERIAAAAREATGGALIAHAYVRYFGDLSGGQIINKRLALPDAALNFYRFPAIAGLATYKTALREALDHAGVLLGDTYAVEEEAAEAFRLNMQLSEAVQIATASIVS